MRKTKRTPAPSCAMCGEALEKIGGKRIVSAQERGVLLCTTQTTLGEISAPARMQRASGAKDKDKDATFVVTCGTGWSEESERRALDATIAGERPWICQRCALLTCARCGSPLESPIASTWLHDDGATSHLMVVPSRVSCINPECPGPFLRAR